MSAIPIDLKPTHRPSVSDLLVQTGFANSTGGSVRGWSALQLAPRCWRAAFYKLVRGLAPGRSSDAMDLGVLYHACMEAHYSTGGVDTYKPLDALQTALPDLVAKTRRLVDAKLRKFGKLESETWDIRAVEYEVVSYVEGKPTLGAYKGRRIKAPVSSKFDLVLAKREPGAPYEPYGPIAKGVYLMDHKTTKALTRDKVAGFGMDPQLLLMAHNWRAAKLEQVFGPLLGVIIELVVNTKEVNIERIEVSIDDRDVQRFMEFLTPWALNLESLYGLPEAERSDQARWPMNYAGCRSAYGMCSYFDLCESHGVLEPLYVTPLDFVPARGLVTQSLRQRKPRTIPTVPIAAVVSAEPTRCEVLSAPTDPPPWMSPAHQPMQSTERKEQ